MNFIRNSFQTIPRAIYDPLFYKEAKTLGLTKALGYFIILSILAALIQIIPIIQPITTTVQTEIKHGLEGLIAYYPKDLKITIRNGLVSTNVKEPYTIPFKNDAVKKDLLGKKAEKDIKNVAVIDTNTKYSKSQFKKYKTILWVSEDTIYYLSDKEDKIEQIDLSKVERFDLNSKTIGEFKNKAGTLITILGPLLLLFSFLGVLLVHILKLVYLMVISLLIFVTSKLFSKQLTYKNAYVIAIFASTLGIIIEVVISNISPLTKIPVIPFLFSAVTLGVVIINVFLAKETK